MPVKVGGSYVSEAAYSFAKAQATDKKEDSGVMKSLAEKFPNLKFSVGTAPFAGTGTNNVSISPKILKQMEQDPEKRLEYEALIYDIANTDKFDWNRVYFAFLTYTKKNGDNKPGLYWEISDIYCDFSPFMNVLD